FHDSFLQAHRRSRNLPSCSLRLRLSRTDGGLKYSDARELLRFALALALIATMFEPSSNIFFGHGSDGCTDSLAQVRRGAWLLTAHEGLDLEPAVLARREVRRVSRQPDHFRLRLGG